MTLHSLHFEYVESVEFAISPGIWAVANLFLLPNRVQPITVAPRQTCTIWDPAILVADVASGPLHQPRSVLDDIELGIEEQQGRKSTPVLYRGAFEKPEAGRSGPEPSLTHLE